MKCVKYKVIFNARKNRRMKKGSDHNALQGLALNNSYIVMLVATINDTEKQ